MRYQWFQDVPRNVTRREFQRLQFRNFCTAGLGLSAAMMAFASLSGLTMLTSKKLAEIDAMTIDDAVVYRGDRTDPIKLEGYLVADDPVTMPDEDSQKVIRGRVRLSARTDTNSGNADSSPPNQETLFEWEESAKSVFLSDGDRRIPLAFGLAVLPMQEEVDDFSPRTIREGEYSRTSRPVAIEYAHQIYPLPLEKWGQIDSVFTDFDRQYLSHGQSVVVVASVEATPQGNQLVDPLGNRLQVLVGTEQEIHKQGQQMRVTFMILSIPLGVASFIVGRSAYRLRQEFVERSNQ